MATNTEWLADVSVFDSCVLIAAIIAGVSVAAMASTGFTWRIFALPAKIGSEQANTC